MCQQPFSVFVCVVVHQHKWHYTRLGRLRPGSLGMSQLAGQNDEAGLVMAAAAAALGAAYTSITTRQQQLSYVMCTFYRMSQCL